MSNRRFGSAQSLCWIASAPLALAALAVADDNCIEVTNNADGSNWILVSIETDQGTLQVNKDIEPQLSCDIDTPWTCPKLLKTNWKPRAGDKQSTQLFPDADNATVLEYSMMASAADLFPVQYEMTAADMELMTPVPEGAVIEVVDGTDVSGFFPPSVLFTVGASGQPLTDTLVSLGLATFDWIAIGNCPGDCNGDGDATILDFVCFQNAWQEQKPKGDCNDDGLFSILDFVCFQGHWVSFAAGACVPDPLFDDFDAYDSGADICGLCPSGCWTSWDDNPDACAQVSSDHAFSGFNSLLVDGTSGPIGDDVVYEFDIDDGQWTLEQMVYVPGDQAGTGYTILLNTYESGGPKNWSLQLRFDPGLGVVESEFDGGLVPLVTDQWIPLHVDIDLDADTQSVYYDGQLVVTKSWSEGVSGDGQTRIEALDLYANEPGAGSLIYYDDVRLSHAID